MRSLKLALAALAAAVALGTAQAEPVKIRAAWVAPVSNWPSIVLEKKDLAKHLGKSYTLETVRFAGTPAMIADQMEEWLTSRGSDGFNIMFPFLPAGLDDFVDKVVPELQKRGIFRTEYEGRTLRENLGLPRPKNRFFEG